MVRSMTGFGRSETNGSNYSVSLELKTVNHRFLDISVRLPRQYASLEEVLRKIISDRLTRGHVDIFLAVKSVGTRPRAVQVDVDLTAGYVDALKKMSDIIGTEPDAEKILDIISRLPDVLRAEEVSDDLEEVTELVRLTSASALDELVAMRESEGYALVQDLTGRLQLISSVVDLISKRSPEVVEDYRTRLTERISELLPEIQVDPTRLAVEVALYADKSNITEELVRLSSHIVQFRDTLMSSGAVGRRLDFLLQEMFREINTIGSKANDFDIATNVVTVKTELEKIREQVQNIE